MIRVVLDTNIVVSALLHVVTGNLRHFPTSWAGSRIVTPRWLLDSLSTGKSETTT